MRVLVLLVLALILFGGCADRHNVKQECDSGVMQMVWYKTYGILDKTVEVARMVVVDDQGRPVPCSNARIIKE